MTKVRRGCAGHSTEFACALGIFFLLLLFPLINLIGFAMAAGTQYLLTIQCASSAGTSTSYPDALSAMESTARDITASGFGRFAKLTPAGGFSGSGTDLFIQRTTLGAGPTTTVYGPNTPFAGVLDDTANVYEYQVRSIFTVEPFLNLSAVPFIASVPMIGQSSRLSFVANRIVEHQNGLTLGGAGTTLASGGGGGSGNGTGSYTSGTGGNGTLPANVTYTTWVASGPAGGYMITINGFLIDGRYIGFTATGRYSSTDPGTPTIATTDTYGANGETGGSNYTGDNPNEAFEFTDYHGTDSESNTHDHEFDITDGGTYSDAAGHLTEAGANDLTPGGNGGVSDAGVSAALIQAFNNFGGWAASNGF